MTFFSKKGEISVKLGGKYIIAIIGIAVGASILFTLASDLPSEQEVREDVMRTISRSESSACRKYENFEEISERDFKVITYSRILEKCDSPLNNVSLGFTLTKPFLREYMKNFNIQSNGEPLWIFREECSSVTGFGGFVVQGEEDSEVIFNKSDFLEIKQFDNGVGICRSEFEPSGEGERCEGEWQCKEKLSCNPSIQNKSKKFCCEEDHKWNGSRCVFAECGDNSCGITDCRIGCEECEGPVNLCIGDGFCTGSIGENCNNSEDCSCNESTFCCPDAPSSIAQKGGCLSFDYLNLPEGSECYCDNMCDASQEFNCNPTSGNFDEYERGCCPKDKVWNGNNCVNENTFRIVVVPANFNFPSEKSSYNQKARQIYRYWLNKSAFKFCSKPEEKVNVLTINETCDVSPELKDVCSGVKGSTPKMCSPQCASSIISCAEDHYPNFHKAIGVYSGDMITSGPLSGVSGCAGLSSTESTNKGSKRGGSIHEVYKNTGKGVGSVHELGHDFGLCHGRGNRSKRPCNPNKDSNCTSITSNVGKCTNCNSSLCPNNDLGDQRDIMNYYAIDPDMKRFFDQEFKHLKEHQQLNDYLEGCNIK